MLEKRRPSHSVLLAKDSLVCGPSVHTRICSHVLPWLQDDWLIHLVFDVIEGLELGSLGLQSGSEEERLFLMSEAYVSILVLPS